MDVFSALPLSAVQPGAYSVLDVSAITQSRGQTKGLVGVLQASLGGKPNTPLNFFSQQDIRNVLRGGKLADAARLAFAGGSQPLVGVRIGTGVAQGTLSLTGAASGALTFTSLGYGSYVNAIKVLVAASNAVTITFTDSLTGVAYSESYKPQGSLTGNAALANIAAQVNGTISGVPKSSLVTAAASPTDAGPLATNGTGAQLTGGADNSTLTGTDWTTGLQALEPTSVDFVVVATDDATIHAQAVAHCLAMSTPTARKERRWIGGGVLGETVATVVTRATNTAIATRRGQLVYPGAQLFDANGNVVMYDPSMVAAYVAGLKCALPDFATSLTHDLLPGVIGVEADLSSIPGGDLDTLLRANITPIARANPTGYWITEDVSLEPSDPNWRDWIKQGSADRVAQRLRARLEGKFTGSKALNGTAGAIKLEAQAEGAAMLGEQLIRDYQPTNVSVVEQSGNPGTFAVTVPVMLVGTTRFIGIVVALQPLNTTQATTPASTTA